MVSLIIPTERFNNGLYEENDACKVSARVIPSQNPHTQVVLLHDERDILKYIK